MNSGCLLYYGLTTNSLADVIKTLLWCAVEECECDAFSAMNIMNNDP